MTSLAPHAPGTLVNVRQRDWIVLPSADPDVLRLRPLTGGDDDAIGIFLPLERRDVRPASFAPPDPAQAGDTMGGLLLRDAARLSLRAGAGPFRSLGQLSVTPRPYQFVPLIMALRLDPVRLLIADDVGVGKTVEAGMIARELLDRGEATRLAVVCPAHLCDQWARELSEKFALDAVVLQPATIGRLERALPRSDLSIYQYYRHLVVSIDWVKSERNRAPFLDNAPDLIVVDEAHIAARPPGGIAGAQHQRYELVRALAADAARHLLLVTATPHSGIEESFRSLLGLLDRRFDADAFGASGELDRRALLPHMVQRRRRDVQQWLGADTPFPERRATERRYALSPAYHKLFEEVLAYCRESVGAADGASGAARRQQRVRHWAAIALLRCVLSSPAAAEAVLGERARRQGLAEAETEMEAATAGDVDAVYAPQVLDALDGEVAADYTPTAPLEDAEPHLDERERRRLSEMLRRARALAGPEHDLKLAAVAEALAGLLRDGFRPIVFCRFIATAKYLEAWLPRRLKAPALRVVAVSGEIGDEERRARIQELVEHPTRVLVATDCLSEGINLQEHFDAVLHYDLPWNPNRLEQREGRVDRFGQARREVRTELLYGADNQVDLVVLDVLIEKARTIRRRLGVAVPVPVQSEQVIQAVVDSVLLRGGGRRESTARLQLQLPFVDEEVSRLHEEWDQAAEREGRQRAYFAQHGIRPDEVARELEATDPVLGDAATVQRFLAEAAQRLGGELHQPAGGKEDAFTLVPGDAMARILRARGFAPPLRIVFDGLSLKEPATAVAWQTTATAVAGEASALGEPAHAGDTHTRVPEAAASAGTEATGAPSANRSRPVVSHATAVAGQSAEAGAFASPGTAVPVVSHATAVAGSSATVLGRTHPIVEAYCNAVLGAALADQSDRRFARCGAVVTDAVATRTAVVVLRLRYLLRERSDGFAEEIVLAAFERRDGAPAWLDPPDERARALLQAARPVAEMAQSERQEQVAWALRVLGEAGAWWTPLVEARVQALQEAHARLRAMVKAPRLTVQPHTPPDILGCYVLVPGKPATAHGGA